MHGETLRLLRSFKNTVVRPQTLKDRICCFRYRILGRRISEFGADLQNCQLFATTHVLMLWKHLE